MMKNIKRFSAVTIIGLVLLMFNSCDDNSEIFTISAPTAPILSELNFTDLELDAVNTANPAVTLNWIEADYGQQASINYAIQFSNDDAFTAPVTAATVTGLSSITLSVNEVNAAAGNAGLNPFEWSTLYIRVIASLGSLNNEASNSNTIQVNVYPYFNYVFNDYYLVGNGVAPGWNNNNNNPFLFRDESDSNVFYYTGFFNNAGGYDEGRFKVLETKGLWQPQWGVTDSEGSDDPSTSGDIAGNPGTQSDDPGRFGVPSSGFYTFTINFASKKYTLEPFDATGITSPTSLTLTGSSTADITMNALAFDGHIWYATAVRLTPGDVTFLTNSGASLGSTTSFSGVATDGGGAIPVIVEDDYDVWFNDLTGRYILIPLNI
ncbi:SusE domain-containing protein [Polaribacter sp. MSW13]|uniref:SusE domain-containing protein n=1 Tax=Polaribacter marinus TaxID=2916838 RepID=A0A9X2ALU9_9FLAO|nr:SusE domain-containing protein [Polaribacter marinus]MCI2228209.1 SusE domain-containing protein [Polaribacter marinus]